LKEHPPHGQVLLIVKALALADDATDLDHLDWAAAPSEVFRLHCCGA